MVDAQRPAGPTVHNPLKVSEVPRPKSIVEDPVTDRQAKVWALG